MLKPNLFILYVNNVKNSEDFYNELLNITPVHSSKTFAMYAFTQGWKLGLWSKDSVIPASHTISECSEVAFEFDSTQEVDNFYKKINQKTEIVQAPQLLDFGYAFTARDPSGHRLRFYSISN